MRVLWCLDGTNVEAVSKATEMLLAPQSLTLGMIHVIDTGPRKDIEHTRMSPDSSWTMLLVRCCWFGR